MDELRKWTERNPIQSKQRDKQLNSRKMAEIGDAFIVENKITSRSNAKQLPPSKIAEKCLATNAFVSIALETNTELTIARAVLCARFVREGITPPSALVTS